MTLQLLLTSLLLIGAGVVVYLYHFRPRGKEATHRREPLFYWPWYEIVDWYLKLSTLVFVLLSIWSDSTWLLEVHRQSWLMVLGWAIAGGSLWLFGSAILHLHDQYTPAHFSRYPSQVIQTGPYRFIRHPIYTANLLQLLGLFVATGSLWLLLNFCILLSYYLPTAILEERKLRMRLPDYEDYFQNTGRFLPKLFR